MQRGQGERHLEAAARVLGGQRAVVAQRDLAHDGQAHAHAVPRFGGGAAEKAPEEVVQDQRDRLTEAEEEAANLRGALARVKEMA